MQNRKRIIAFSPDFDGCLFHNRGYEKSDQVDPLIDKNRIVIHQMLAAIREYHYAEAVFLVGSNRQSYSIDQLNGTIYGVGSCYPALHKLAGEISRRHGNILCRVDSYLLSDTYGDRRAGENFNKSLANDNKYDYSQWVFDESKITILYAQMHKLASENPDTDISYHFYDDRCYDDDDPQDILFGVKKFFELHLDLIPNNLTLNLHFYNGEEFKTIAALTGDRANGLIDSNYHQSVKLITKIVGADSSYRKKINVRELLSSSERIDEFRKQRNANIQVNSEATALTY